jgi:hypothetical protein
MPDGTDLGANAGYLVAAALVTVAALGAYAVSVARRLDDARERHAASHPAEGKAPEPPATDPERPAGQ